jgi:TorA maturation chaperone TorD
MPARCCALHGILQNAQRPLARLREAFQGFGIEIAPERSEPEDHVAILCEVMAGLADGSIQAPPGADREFFQQHLSPWIGRFFIDLEHAEAADFYSAVGLLERTFVALEAEAFSRPDTVFCLSNGTR